jgi:glycosyltransferase involved in cell wall biosynthesis
VTSKGRVALLHYTALPVVGGVEVILSRHAALLADAGYQVTIVAGRGRSGDPRVAFARIPIADTLHPRVRAARLELDRGAIPPSFGSLVEEATAALAEATATCDVVIAHNIASLPMNLALTAALHTLTSLRTGPRVVLWHHDVAAAMDSYRDQLHPGWPWDLVRTGWPRTTSVAVSTARATAYARTSGISPAEVRVVPNGVEPAEVLEIHPTTRRLVRGRGIERAAPILLAPVRLNPRKNLELAIKVAASLRSLMSGAVLVVTGARDPHDPGSGAYHARLRALAREHGVEATVHIVSELVQGPPSPRLVRDLYRLADAIILPSRDEGFGLPVLEAGLHRLPVFCADIEALRELAGQDATVFPPDAPADEIGILIRDRLASDPVYRAAVRARTAYDMRTIFDTAIEPLIASLVSSSTA